MFEIRFKNSLNSSTASGFIKSLELKESFESSTEIFDKEVYEEPVSYTHLTLPTICSV